MIVSQLLTYKFSNSFKILDKISDKSNSLPEYREREDDFLRISIGMSYSCSFTLIPIPTTIPN